MKFITKVAIVCSIFILYVGSNFLPPVLSGLILATGLRPLLEKIPFKIISSFKVRKLTLLISFMSVFGVLTTYVVVASAKGIVRNVEGGGARQVQSDSSASPDSNVIEVDEHVAYKESNGDESSSLFEKAKNAMKKIPGLNSAEVTQLWSESLNRARDMALGILSKILAAGPTIFIQWAVFLISFVLFFWHYEQVMDFFRSFSKRYTEAKDCVKFFENAAQATLLGTLVVGTAQGSIVGIGSAVAGFDSFMLLAIATFFASFIPFFGAATVWVCLLVYTISQGNTQAAIIIGITGCISTVADNLILSTFVGSKSKVHPLLLFTMVISFVELVGVWGLFLGPVLAIFSTRILELWYKQLLPKEV